MRYCWLIAFLFSSVAFAAPPADYYRSAEGKTGAVLKTALHKIIDGQRPLPYTKSGNDNWLDGENMDVWEALAFTDSACPDDQPKCGKIRLLYLDEVRGLDQANRGTGTDDSWDREHVWPKSRGFPKQSQDGYTDLHHLRPADRNLNGKHSNYGYDEGGAPVIDKREGLPDHESGAFFDKDGESFEPPDRAKGQVARMLFYMAVRYEKGDDASPELMPDLVLKDENKREKKAWIGDLCTLVKWNREFPPTEFEQRRNDRVMEIQGNRNPFIDHPAWADELWGGQCD